MEKEEKNEEPIDTSINAIPICYIDPEGTFKYVQISCNNKIYVRGIAKYKYHKGIYKSFIAELAKFGLDKEYPTKCLGGGRIKITPSDKSIFVYGYSHAYGRCKHQITCDILKTMYKEYNISWSNDGYLYSVPIVYSLFYIFYTVNNKLI